MTIVTSVHYRWESLAPGVRRCRLPFLDVTVGVVIGSAGVLLVDCGSTLVEAANIAADIAAESALRVVTHIVLTHHHFDHILGSAGFPAARVYAASPVAEALTIGVESVGEDALRYGTPPDQVAEAIRGVRAPGEIITGGRIDLGDRTVYVEHPGRGHTDHDLVVVATPVAAGEPTVVFCGDLVEESADPAIDEGSDVTAWPQTLDRVLELGGSQARYVPGHGSVVDAAFVRHQRDWLARR